MVGDLHRCGLWIVNKPDMLISVGGGISAIERSESV